MRAAELFAGAGGMALGFHRAGWETAWTCELAGFPSRVTRYHWPHVPQYGDVSTLDGRALVARHGPIDLLAGGSPCQDLSVAGKRAGFGGIMTVQEHSEPRGIVRTRSSLFFHQMRLWNETGAPLCLWENVAGALSSHHGKDFAAVLSAFVGAAVPVPRDGWNGDRSSGVVSGPAGVAAWRLLDAQYFGVAQRRLRVFVLGARGGKLDPAQVLLEPEGVYGHPPTRESSREGSAGSAGNRVTGASGVAPTLCENYRNRGNPIPEFYPLAFHMKGDGGDYQSDFSPSLRANADSFGGAPPAVLAFDTTQVTSALNRSNPRAGDPCHPLAAQAHAPLVVCATGEITHALKAEGHDGGEDGTGRGVPIVARCVTTREGAALDYETTTMLVAGTLESRTNGGGFPGTDGACSGHVVPSLGIPRRLTPRECERLMSWPDDWTLVPDAKGKPASDAQRYKAIGNGVVSNVAQWIAARTAHYAP